MYGFGRASWRLAVKARQYGRVKVVIGKDGGQQSFEQHIDKTSIEMAVL
jgi:hypothetical protein